MNKYGLSHLSDRELLRDLAALVARERTTTAALLAHIAEVDERRLYLPAAAERLPQPELPAGVEAAPALPTAASCVYRVRRRSRTSSRGQVRAGEAR